MANKKIYYILFLILLYGIMLLLPTVYPSESGHRFYTYILWSYIVIALLALRLIKKEFKDIIHLIIMCIFIVLF
jgi:hypothetical protein